MLFTQKTKYGIQATLYMAINRERDSFSTKELSNSLDISYSYLAKIVKELSDAGLLITVRGKGGGLQLARCPEEISLCDILFALEKNHPLLDCRKWANNHWIVNQKDSINTIYYIIRDELCSFLKESTLEDLTSYRQFNPFRLSEALTCEIL